ncbi:MAG: hypothetical protein AAGF01_28765 [Cyanobacteria bacterium P01_G01_bin.38]
MTTISVQSQLTEAEQELTAQEAALTQQLEDIREKRKGLQMVIAMFGGQSAPPSVEATVEDAPVLETEATPEVKTETEVPAKTPKSKLSRQAKPKKAAASTKTTKKVDGRAASWQRYIRDEYKEMPLPDVVVGILTSEPKSSFKIAAVMTAIFTEDMPKAQYLKARNRISNILSGGARKGEWYRGRGVYSLSKKAV